MALHHKISKSIINEVTNIKKISKYARIFQIIPLLVYITVIYFFIQLEKKECSCAQKYNQRFIKYSIYFLFFLSLIVFVIGPSPILKFVYQHLGPISTSIIRLGLLFFIIFLMVSIYKYVQYLRKGHCKCATDSPLDEILQYYSVTVLIILFSALLITLFFNLLHIHQFHVSELKM